jgi:hypothetical protein
MDDEEGRDAGKRFGYKQLLGDMAPCRAARGRETAPASHAGESGESKMAMGKKAVLAIMGGAMVLVATSAPVSAQRYCQRELEDGTEPDAGCTAPVGGVIGKTDPSRSSTTTQSDAEKLEELMDVAVAQPE